jgi:L,D-peptidoglycan transpeptidase YkuD (ErfK/YbiS/YcfS/YnhG family)
MPAIAMSDADFVYENGMLSWPGGSARAACGKAGITADKREGDHASPAGTFPLLRAFYRPDRLAAPKTALPLTALKLEDGWCDDPADRRYNTLVALPYPASHEEL